MNPKIGGAFGPLWTHHSFPPKKGGRKLRLFGRNWNRFWAERASGKRPERASKFWRRGVCSVPFLERLWSVGVLFSDRHPEAFHSMFVVYNLFTTFDYNWLYMV